MSFIVNSATDAVYLDKNTRVSCVKSPQHLAETLRCTSANARARRRVNAKLLDVRGESCADTLDLIRQSDRRWLCLRALMRTRTHAPLQDSPALGIAATALLTVDLPILHN